MSQFKRDPKEKTTEPSVDELSHEGMKRGGKAHKKHMAMGGNPMMRAPLARPMVRPGMRAGVAPSVAMPPAALMRKKGGEVESAATHKAEMHEMRKIEKELKHHESEKAGKAHHGLKKGGMYRPTPGGLLSEGRAHGKGTTGGIEGAGYKHGGMSKGGTMRPKIDVQDKVHEAKQVKSLSTKTGGIEGAGYKHGGRSKKHHYAKGGTVSDGVASRYLNDMKDGKKMPTKKLGAKGISQAPAGYKNGGHVSHPTTYGHKDNGHKRQHEMQDGHGHEKMAAHPMKNGGKAHTTKISTCMQKGGKCNY